MIQKRKDKNRCDWPGENQLMVAYHDKEWGVPVHDDKKLFEFFVLDAFQAGLSWAIVLNKRKGFKKAFLGFDYKKVAKFAEKDVQRLKNDAGIIRNELKIRAAISNAQKFLEIQKESRSFDKFIWRFVNYKPIKNKFKTIKELPATSPESDTMSKELKKRGLKFVGSTICYAFMQAAGMVNDHTVNCFRHDMIRRKVVIYER